MTYMTRIWLAVGRSTTLRGQTKDEALALLQAVATAIDKDSSLIIHTGDGLKGLVNGRHIIHALIEEETP